MRTVVVEPVELGRRPGRSVASAALGCEGWEHEVRHVQGDRGYGELLAELWRTSPDGFILVEDDVAPWPGAVYALMECDEPWCAYDYSIGAEGGFGVMRGLMGLGCMKFNGWLVADNPALPVRWAGTHWRQLDAAVHAAIEAGTGLRAPHEHEPGVAHCKHLR
jgi:hypothetical protein